jgi:rhodanese-related sulfurtransferase
MLEIAVVAIVVVLFGFFMLMPRKSAMGSKQKEIAPAQYQTDFVQAKRSHLLLDVRTPEEFAGGHIAGARNIALQALPKRLAEVPRDRPVVIYCRSGNRSGQAMRLLQQAGYDDLYDLGGIMQWNAQGQPTQRQPSNIASRAA